MYQTCTEAQQMVKILWPGLCGESSFTFFIFSNDSNFLSCFSSKQRNPPYPKVESLPMLIFDVHQTCEMKLTENC